MVQPNQNRFIDPYSSYSSENVNRLTRFVTSGEDKICRSDHLVPLFYFSLELNDSSNVDNGDVYKDPDNNYWRIVEDIDGTHVKVRNCGRLDPTITPSLGSFTKDSGTDSNTINVSSCTKLQNIYITSGFCVKDDVVIEIKDLESDPEESDQELDLNDSSNYIVDETDPIPPFNTFCYVVLDYQYVKQPTPPKAYLKILYDISEFDDKYIFLGQIEFDSDSKAVSITLEDTINNIERSELNLTDGYDDNKAIDAVGDSLIDSNTVSFDYINSSNVIHAHVIPDNKTIERTSSGIGLIDALGDSTGITETHINFNSFGNGIGGGSGVKIQLSNLETDWDIGGDSEATITNVPNPQINGDVSNKGYVDNAVSGINFSFKTLPDTPASYLGYSTYVALVNSSEDSIIFDKIRNSNIATGANIDWNKINKTGSHLSDFGVPNEDISFNDFRLFGLQDPIHMYDAATKNYVDLNTNRDVKLSCKVTTVDELGSVYDSTNLTLTSTLNENINDEVNIDSLSINSILEGDRILVVHQSDESQNGLYQVSSLGSIDSKWVLVRASDYDSQEDITNASIVSVSLGENNGKSLWMQVEYDPQLDVDPIKWKKITGITNIEQNISTSNLTVNHNLGHYPIIQVFELIDSEGSNVTPPAKIQPNILHTSSITFEINFGVPESHWPQKVRILYY